MSTLLALAASLLVLACGGNSSVYVGVAAPGPWYGYPHPGMYPGGGVWVGVPVCCEEDADAMAEPAETSERYAEAGSAAASEAAQAELPAAPQEPAANRESEDAAGQEERPGG
jgi:hypothetical protein